MHKVYKIIAWVIYSNNISSFTTYQNFNKVSEKKIQNWIDFWGGGV